jgi:hypothetical protein
MGKYLIIKINIKDIDPPIWRELIIKDDISFQKLHETIQLSFGWTNSHLWQFEIDNRIIVSPQDPDFEDEERDISVENSISELFYVKGQKISYIYDMGDYWEHEIELKKKLNKNEHPQCPYCVNGKRNCPPEDCGGVPGYEELREVLSDTSHPEYEDRVEWLGEIYDFEYFDLKEINAMLKNPEKYLMDDFMDDYF